MVGALPHLSMSELPVTKGNITIGELDAIISSVLLMKDECVTRLVAYNVVGNALRLGPIWTVVVAPPSGGKSELLQAALDVDRVYMLSSLTAQTFISGMRGVGGKSSSLLDELDGQVLMMKDLTTIVEMNKDERRAILSQLREIYDKRFSKAFGTGERKFWEGHVGFLAAITDKGAELFSAHGAMGERFIFYKFKQPDRMQVLERATYNNANDFEGMQLRMRQGFVDFVEPRLKAIDSFTPELQKKILENKDLVNTIFEITNFATMARSTVEHDFKSGKILYVHPHEMPTRFAMQLIALGKAAIFCHALDPVPTYELDAIDMKMLVDIAWGSIPSQRAACIDVLAEYKSGSTKGIAATLGYETDIARGWLADLAALKIISRDAAASNQDRWEMPEETRKKVCKYRNLRMLDVTLEGTAYRYDEDGNDMYGETAPDTTEDYMTDLAKEMNEGITTNQIDEDW